MGCGRVHTSLRAPCNLTSVPRLQTAVNHQSTSQKLGGDSRRFSGSPPAREQCSSFRLSKDNSMVQDASSAGARPSQPRPKGEGASTCSIATSHLPAIRHACDHVQHQQLSCMLTQPRTTLACFQLVLGVAGPRPLQLMTKRQQLCPRMRCAGMGALALMSPQLHMHGCCSMHVMDRHAAGPPPAHHSANSRALQQG